MNVRPSTQRPVIARGLYLLTPDDQDTARLLARTRPLLAHASLLQYRNKQADSMLRREQAAMLLDACRAARVPLIVNDDVALASELGADGVHLGEHDDAVAEARARLGRGALVGMSCYDDPARALQAARDGADYVAFGAFFPSPNKPAARRATPALLRATAGLGLPRVAIGGITPDNAAQLVDAGADLVAAISGVYCSTDPAAAARAIQALFD